MGRPAKQLSLSTPRNKNDFTPIALQLRLNNNMSYGQIAEQLKKPRTTIYNRLKPIENLLQDTDLFQLYNADTASILKATEATLLSNLLNKDKLQKASLNNVAYAYQQVFNARRLESNQSTSNVSVSIEARLRRALDSGKQHNSENTDSQE
jgi:hypothetical protein